MNILYAIMALLIAGCDARPSEPRMGTASLCPIAGSCIGAGVPLTSLSTDGGVDGGVPTNVAGVIEWKAPTPGSGGGSFSAGVDLRAVDGGQRVVSAENGSIQFSDAGVISVTSSGLTASLSGPATGGVALKIGTSNVVYWSSNNLYFQADGANQQFVIIANSESNFAKNLAVGTNTGGDYGGCVGCFAITSTATTPTGAPTSAGDAVIYTDTTGVESWISTGIKTTVAGRGLGTIGTQARYQPTLIGYLTNLGSAGTGTLNFPIGTQATFGETCYLHASMTLRTRTLGTGIALGDSAVRVIDAAFWENAAGTIARVGSGDVSLDSTTLSTASMTSASLASSISGSSVILTGTNATGLSAVADGTIVATMVCN